MERDGDTIAALATAPAPAGVAVIRVSGEKAAAILSRFFRSERTPADAPRELIYGNVLDDTGEAIDSGLAVFMPGPKSFTGEDVAEFQIHGSPVLAQKLLRALVSSGLVRMAEAGEFTRRAFLNGKLDLTQAEAIAEVIEASSEHGLRVAKEHLEGKLSSVVDGLGEPLRDALAELEAGLDFPEEDIEPDNLQKIETTLHSLSKKLSDLSESYRSGAKLREGFKVLLCGPPNAGKSSLLNALLGRRRAIVSEISGTTRDLIEESMTLDGFRLVLCDSAGITETEDQIERIGVELSLERLEWADLVLVVVDGSDPELDWKALLKLLEKNGKPLWLIRNKSDLETAAIPREHRAKFEKEFQISVAAETGLDLLRKALTEKISSLEFSTSETSLLVTEARHYDCLRQAKERLDEALAALRNGLPGEVVSAEIRLSLKALEELVGKTYTEDILGRIFSKFCIGK